VLHCDPLMGKRLKCPRCTTANDYDVPAQEMTASHREVRCRACGHRFGYGFRPEYVTEDQNKERRVTEPFDDVAQFAAARERLTQYVGRYPEYHDRDRDILLLHLLNMGERLDEELAGIRRTLNVLATRGR